MHLSSEEEITRMNDNFSSSSRSLGGAKSLFVQH